MTDTDQNLDYIAPILLVSLTVGSVVFLFAYSQHVEPFVKENFEELFYSGIVIAAISNLVVILFLIKQVPRAIYTIKFFARYVRSKGWRTKTIFPIQDDEPKVLRVCEQVLPFVLVISIAAIDVLCFIDLQKSKMLIDSIAPVSNHLSILATVAMGEFFFLGAVYSILAVFASGVLFDIWNDCYGYVASRRTTG